MPLMGRWVPGSLTVWSALKMPPECRRSMILQLFPGQIARVTSRELISKCKKPVIAGISLVGVHHPERETPRDREHQL
jgi:hypothetical protein